MMKRVIVFLFILLSILLTACSITNEVKNNDWSYELPNNYVIWHINSREIVCGKKNSPTSISSVVNEYVSEFCYNEKLIGLKCAEVPENINDEIDMSKPIYYVIDLENDILYGGFNEEEYLTKVQEYEYSDLTGWITTKPRPSEAVFY